MACVLHNSFVCIQAIHLGSNEVSTAQLLGVAAAAGLLAFAAIVERKSIKRCALVLSMQVTVCCVLLYRIKLRTSGCTLIFILSQHSPFDQPCFGLFAVFHKVPVVFFLTPQV